MSGINAFSSNPFIMFLLTCSFRNNVLLMKEVVEYIRIGGGGGDIGRSMKMNIFLM